MYDPVETDLSFEYLLNLCRMSAGLRLAVIGGWGVYFHVSREYKRAFGTEYLKSRDIDVLVDAGDELRFLEIIKKLGFSKSAYSFRYELVYDREEKALVRPEAVKKRPVFNLAYVFLDVFSNKKTKKLGSWVFDNVSLITKEIDNIPVLDVGVMLKLKTESFFEREKLDKELKDACDIYALLFYADKRPNSDTFVTKAALKILKRPDLQEFIAREVLGDAFKAGIVRKSLEGLG